MQHERESHPNALWDALPHDGAQQASVGPVCGPHNGAQQASVGRPCVGSARARVFFLCVGVRAYHSLISVTVAMTESVDAFLLVSIGTVPSRISLLVETVRQLKLQTRQPNETLLVLPTEFDAHGKPHAKKSLANFESGLAKLLESHAATREDGRRSRLATWRVTVDYGPVMKLVGALQFLHEHPLPPEHAAHTLLVTLDDDMDYPSWLCENLVKYALRYPTATLAYAGGVYHGLPSAPDDYARGQRYDVRGPLPNGHKHLANPSCTLRKVNYLLGWAGVIYRPSHFDDAFFADLAELAAICHWCDDQYISHHLNRRHVPILMPPLPLHAHFHVRSRMSAARNSPSTDKTRWMQTASLMMRFRGKGADKEWSMPFSYVCLDGCASRARPKCTNLTQQVLGPTR